ncbi:MAG: hypothetical protein AAF624_07605 [Bacteroidota bacterium]
MPALAVEPSDAKHALQQVLAVELALGVALADERRLAVVRALAERGYTRADLEQAATELAADPSLDAKLRYGGALTAADFRRVIEGDTQTTGRRLLTYDEAVADALRLRIGLEHYMPVFIAGEPKPRWRRKGTR